MPLTNTTTFRVRYHECDPLGFLKPVSLARYMQEAAFDATEAAGYGFNHYQQNNRVWLARTTTTHLTRPLRYEEDVRVTTWVNDFYRVVSHRRYEITLPGSAELVGTAATEWVFLDTLSGRPARIPPEMIAAFFPEGAPEETTQPEPIPSVEPPASGVFRVQPRVGWRDIDSALHMNNTSYFDYLSDCSIQALAAGGWSYQRFLSEGFTVQPLQMQIKYQQPALAGDVLDVLTWNSSLEQERLKQHYQINRSADGVLLAHATIRSACVSLVSGLPVPFSPALASEVN